MIPDKIYFPEGGLPTYIDWDGSPVRTKQVEDTDICYVRKDALWKPTPEQLKALNAINCFGELSYQGQQQHLIDLHQQLKQLCNEQ